MKVTTDPPKPAEPDKERAAGITWTRFLVFAGGVLVVVFAALMPSASEGLGLIGRVLFWITHVFGALLILQGVQMALGRWTWLTRHSPWLQVFLSGVLGATLFAPVAGVLDQVFGLDAVTDDATETLGAWVLSEFTAVLLPVTAVWLGLNASRLVHIQTHRPGPRAPQTAAQEAPRFWDQVPRAIGRDLIALSAELHYLRVTTRGGDALILSPFGQAVAALSEGATGLQIHRSHWVAVGAIREVKRRGQGGEVTLVTGLVLPVSRSRMADLRALWPLSPTIRA